MASGAPWPATWPTRREVPHISSCSTSWTRLLLAAHTESSATGDDGVTPHSAYLQVAVHVAIEVFPILNSSLDADHDELVLHGAVRDMGIVR